MSHTYHIASPFRLSIKPEQDLNYLRFIRDQQCCVCSSFRRSEAAHFGARGKGQKANDRQALPLCGKHHREHHAIGTVKFSGAHKLDIEKLILEFNALYVQSNSKKKPLDRVRLNPADLMREA